MYPLNSNHFWSHLFLILGLLAMSGVPARGATLVSGNVSGNWTTNLSPYILSADCIVASDQTLTIQPGVVVIGGPNVRLQVEGDILAVATPGAPIVFQGTTPGNYWAGIAMDYSGRTNRFQFCRFRDVMNNAALSFNVYGNDHVMRGEIRDCDFLACRTGGIYGTATADFASKNPVLELEIHNCVFDSTAVGCVFGAFYYNEPTPGNPAVNSRMTGNLFKNMSEAALLLYGGFPNASATNYSHPVFLNNTVANCRIAVDGEESFFDAIVRNNLFIGNSNAVYRRTGAGNSDVSFNCFFGNIANFVLYPGIYGVPFQPNANSDPCDAFFNIFLDPGLLDTNRFLLSKDSPCVDAGDPAVSDVCFDFSLGTAISDIGAYGGPDACGWLNHGFAPVITGSVRNQSSCAGGGAVFRVRADGSEPLFYQWFLNGTNQLGGATNAQLNLDNLQAAQAGLYSASVSNAFGMAVSAPARLLVSDACVDLSLYAGLSITGIVGRTYTVECATNLAATNWTILTTNIFTQPRWLFIDTNNPVDARKFVRVRLQP